MPPATQSSIQEIIEDMEPSCPSEILLDNKEALNLAEAINLMTEELKCHDNKNSKAKAKEPDTFDGSNPHKLTSFLLLCNLYFCNNLLMRLHYLWPQKLQNCTIPVNLEAIWTTTIASKTFWPLYLGYNQVLHYIIYGLWLSNFDIALAFNYDRHPQTYLVSSNISSKS